MRYAIARTLLDRLVAEAAASPGAEICGLLFGDETGIRDARAAANVAADPAARFELDPAALFAAMRAERGGGPRVIGHYHSHPGGAARPSPCDAADAIDQGRLWLIIGGGDARLWRARKGGSIEGAFDPIELFVHVSAAPSACIAPPQSPQGPRAR